MGKEIYPHVAGMGRQGADGIMVRRFVISTAIFFTLLSIFIDKGICGGELAGKEPLAEKPRFAGQFFEVLVPVENYSFVRSVLVVFGNKFGVQPRTPEEFDNCVWDHLLYSYEAFRRGITVQRGEIDKEIDDILKAGGADFDRKKDKEAYEKWIKGKTNEPVELFENQIKHLLEVQKVREQVMSEINPAVTNKEAYQAFLDEQNHLGVELTEFSEKDDAVEFYKKARANPGFWEEEKARRPKDFKNLGTVTLIFLMDLWKFPRDAVYKMMSMKKGEIYGPRPIYKGFGVFKVLAQRRADISQYKDNRNAYIEKVRAKKRYEGLGKWFENLKKEAEIVKNYDKDKGGKGV